MWGSGVPVRLSWKGLDGWLEEQALEHDRPVTLFAMAWDHLMAEGVVRLGVTTIERAVVSARGRAWTETLRRLEPQLTPERRRNLDGLLAVDPDRAMSPLAWFRRLPAGRSSAQIRELVQVKQQLIDVPSKLSTGSLTSPLRHRRTWRVPPRSRHHHCLGRRDLGLAQCGPALQRPNRRNQQPPPSPPPRRPRLHQPQQLRRPRTPRDMITPPKPADRSPRIRAGPEFWAEGSGGFLRMTRAGWE